MLTRNQFVSMPRSPLSHPLIVTQNFLDRPSIYPETHGHSGIDFHSPLGDDWFSVVPGFFHLLDYGKFVWKLTPFPHKEWVWTAYGAAIGLDWGQADGSFIRFLYGHGKNRRKELDNHHVEEGRFLCDSGNTGFSDAAHLHFEMRKYPKDNSGEYYDPRVKRHYHLLNPLKEFFQPYKIPYKFS